VLDEEVADPGERVSADDRHQHEAPAAQGDRRGEQQQRQRGPGEVQCRVAAAMLAQVERPELANVRMRAI